jgi:hypothetical protein
MVGRYGSPWFLFHRVDLHKELMRLVSEPRPHTSATAKIHLLSEIVDLDLEGNLTMADGTRLNKDLVIVADGIRVSQTILIFQRINVDSFRRGLPAVSRGPIQPFKLEPPARQSTGS